MKQTELKRTTPLKRSSAPPRRRPISPASAAQRKKVRMEPCVVTGVDMVDGLAVVDPAHLASRAHGGCDDPLCVVPLVRHLHRQFDEGNFDLLPYLVGRRVPELQHALGHYDGDLLSLIQRLTGERSVVVGEEKPWLRGLASSGSSIRQGTAGRWLAGTRSSRFWRTLRAGRSTSAGASCAVASTSRAHGSGQSSR